MPSSQIPAQPATPVVVNEVVTVEGEIGGGSLPRPKKVVRSSCKADSRETASTAAASAAQPR